MRASRSWLRAGLVALVALALTMGAPLAVSAAPAAEPDRYIVTVQSTSNDASQSAVTSDAAEKVDELGGEVESRMSAALDALVVTLPSADAVAELRADPNVVSVTADRLVSIDTTQSGPPSWGLDRIDQAALPVDSTYYYANTGASVRIYIVDTGVRSSHQDFGGRVVAGYTPLTDGNGTNDCNGHGTHVAGTAAGTAYGVAKGATIVPVRVLGCSGSGYSSDVIRGLDWIAANNPSGTRAVVSMSIGGGAYQPEDDAIATLVGLGIPVVVAAGNSNASACSYSPARAPAAITVAATTSADARASYSNYGSCVDLFAPGSSIVSDYYTSDSATTTMSGTSMATPHVSGVVAQYLQRYPTYTPAQIQSAMVAGSTSGAVTDPGGSPNVLLRALHTVADAPTGVAASISGTAATITWTAPAYDGGRLTGYAVYVSTDGGTTFATATSATASLSASYVQSGLLNGTSYAFAVAAVNPDGTGARSSASNAVTPDPTAPINDTATVVEGSSVLIDVVANDPVGAALLAIATSPVVGTSVIEAGRIRYTAPASSAGSATFTYTITGSAITASVTITITAIPASVPAPAGSSGGGGGGGGGGGSDGASSVPIVAPLPALVPVAAPAPAPAAAPATAPVATPAAAPGLDRVPALDGVNKTAPAAASPARAPRVAVAEGEPLDLKVKGLEGSRATFHIKIGGSFILLGTGRVNASGSAVAPTFAMQDPGVYTVRVTSGGLAQFVKLVVT